MVQHSTNETLIFFAAYLTQIFAPIITFAVYMTVARRNMNEDSVALSTAQVYSSLSIFALLTDPITSLVMSLYTFMASLGCFTRIQEFLEKDILVDPRVTASVQVSEEEFLKVRMMRDSSEKESIITSDIGAVKRSSVTRTLSRSYDLETVMIHNADFAWDRDKSPLLKSITMSVLEGQFTMVVGPVGCGKSTLLKAILGEVPCTRGSVFTATDRVAYCDQTAWHMNDTIRNSITASAEFDERWYTTVLHSCALEQDLFQLPRGDQTKIGSQGVALSTGQSQRVVISSVLVTCRWNQLS
jgi:ABC-type multidrug transport system fused ATPase/permease subunit